MTPTAIAAHLDVHDVGSSVDWFRHTLGFTLHSCTGEPPHYAEIRRDAVRIALHGLRGPVLADDSRAHQGVKAASIEVDRLDILRELYERARITGAFISRRIEARPWGVWAFVMRDLDGNLLMLSAPQHFKPDEPATG
ncbi:MAG: VOC family protein [Burkholderiales bacterium]|jgi:uncharacterized glyoxalase superfamily protein PhnB